MRANSLIKYHLQSCEGFTTVGWPSVINKFPLQGSGYWVPKVRLSQVHRRHLIPVDMKIASYVTDA